MRYLLMVFVVVLACGKPASRCSTNADCMEGGKCAAGACAYACSEVQCLDGHFCDLSTQQCVADCPFPCNPPDHSTADCVAECTYTCQPGYYLDEQGQCPPCDNIDRCGTACAPCPAPPEHGEATCTAGSCGFNCLGDFHVLGDTCESNASLPRFVRHTSVAGQPTVTDRNGLIWQGCAVGQSGDNCEGPGQPLSWSYLKSYCESTMNSKNWGGYSTGWRLPMQPTEEEGELTSLLMRSCPTDGTTCLLDANVFPNAPVTWFWSSDRNAADTLGRMVHFGDGNVAWEMPLGPDRAGVALARCVRDQ